MLSKKGYGAMPSEENYAAKFLFKIFHHFFLPVIKLPTSVMLICCQLSGYCKYCIFLDLTWSSLNTPLNLEIEL